MSRIGKNPVALPQGVTATVQDGTVSVKGPKGEMNSAMTVLPSHRDMTINDRAPCGECSELW
jgi:large subunit ribosomal protein L6